MSQFLDRVKWGDGHNGSAAVSGTINIYGTCTGTIGGTSLTTAMPATAGDIVIIHQSQGTGAGQWEINYVVTDAGATLTLLYPLTYTYSAGAQVVLVPQYTGGTLSGAVTGTAWNGSSGGIIALMSKGDLTISGSISINGGNGGTYTAGTGGGFRGGVGVRGFTNNYAYCGEGTNGATARQRTANGNGGGGGGVSSSGDSGGGGGANGDNGSNGTGTGSSTLSYGLGGSASGAAALTTITFGGGGGGGAQDGDTSGDLAYGGGSGGGIIFVLAKSITLTGTISANGGNGGTGLPTSSSGGGGAGGSVLIKTQSATLGTNKITASAGTAAVGGGGGNGSVGRIHIDYSDAYTGTTSPTINATQNTTLKVQPYGGML